MDKQFCSICNNVLPIWGNFNERDILCMGHDSKIKTTREVMEEELKMLCSDSIKIHDPEKQYLADPLIKIYKHTFKQSIIRIVQAALEEAKAEMCITIQQHPYFKYGEESMAYKQQQKIDKILKSLEE